MAKLLADENFPFPVVEHLRRRGHDVVTMKDLGQSGAGCSDEQVLQYAANEGRVILTMDRRDFRSLHRSGVSHSGMVICTFNPDWSNFAAQIDQTLQSVPRLTGELMQVRQPR